MSYSYEEIRSVVIDLLAGREKGRYELEQYSSLLENVGEVLNRRSRPPAKPDRNRSHNAFGNEVKLAPEDSALCLEVFWDLFRQGIITIGLNDSNRTFPFFRVSSLGKKFLEDPNTYFFHDVSTYEKLIRDEITKIDDVTMLYLKESMQAFRVDCLLSSTVMLGVATEHTFERLIETINAKVAHAKTFEAMIKKQRILERVTSFKSTLDSKFGNLPREIKEDLDTHFMGILSIIRNFRNESGHPTGQFISREQCYVLLSLFIPYGKKMYQLMEFFSKDDS